MKIVELKPIKETTEDYERIEKAIKELFRQKIYIPLIKEFGEPQKTLKNSQDDLFDAIRSGRITFYRGQFSGRFNASISKELKRLGAEWDRKTGTWKVSQSSLPHDVRNVISASESHFQQKIAAIDKKLAQILPEEIAAQLSITKLFDAALWKTEKKFQESVKNITVAPKLTTDQAARIASEWQTNMDLWIKDFIEEEIVELRSDIAKSVFAGNRYGSAVEAIQKSYRVSANKAKFLARQETALLMSKFKEVRYSDAGIHEYKWEAVVGSPKHPTRPRHKELADASKRGKIYRWDDPPVTTAPGEPERRNNPGEDYNCRCTARPIVRFK